MTEERVSEWLAARRPAPPPELAERLRSVLAAMPEESLGATATMTEAMRALGQTTLRAVAQLRDASAEHALDLLAADAFVTYLFEAAAEESVDVAPIVARLLKEASAA